MKDFSYCIATDSCANLPDALFRAYDIRVIPMIYIVDGEERLSYSRDAQTDLRAYYALMREKVPMSTSCVARENCEAVFTEILNEGKDILYIGFSSGLSATFDVAAKVMEELGAAYPGRKLIAVDSLSASLGQGLLIAETAKRQEQGADLETAAQWAADNRLKTAHFFTVDTLQYLYRGGRLKKTAYLLGNALNIRPVLRVNNEGHLEPIAKTLGRRPSLRVIADHIADNIGDPETAALYIGHGDCIEDVEALLARIRDRMPVKDENIVINYIDLVIGVHSGPGTIAAFCMAAKR